ncbi:hypothetical protein Hanom_Chr16g01449461 [Helianthus anomalus]
MATVVAVGHRHHHDVHSPSSHLKERGVVKLPEKLLEPLTATALPRTTSPSLPATARRRRSSPSFSLFSSEISSVSRRKSNERGVWVLSEEGGV